MYKVVEYPHISPVCEQETLHEVKKQLASKFKDRHNNTKYIVFNDRNWIVAIITRKDYLYGRQ